MLCDVQFPFLSVKGPLWHLFCGWGHYFLDDFFDAWFLSGFAYVDLKDGKKIKVSEFLEMPENYRLRVLQIPSPEPVYQLACFSDQEK